MKTLKFASTKQALQHLADLTGKRIKVARRISPKDEGYSAEEYVENVLYDKMKEQSKKITKAIEDKVNVEFVDFWQDVPYDDFEGSYVGDGNMNIEFYLPDDPINKEDIKIIALEAIKEFNSQNEIELKKPSLEENSDTIILKIEISNIDDDYREYK